MNSSELRAAAPLRPERPVQPERPLVAVFASAEAGLLPAYEQAAGEVGERLAEMPIQLVVEGAGSSGLLGAVVAPVLAAGLPVIQVVVGQLGADRQPSQHWVVADHQRGRQRVVEEADALLFLPGGTECCTALLEALQVRQDRRPAPPLLLCNTAQFFLPLLGLLTHLEASGFLSPVWRQGVWCAERPRTLLAPMLCLPSWRQWASAERAGARGASKGGSDGQH